MFVCVRERERRERWRDAEGWARAWEQEQGPRTYNFAGRSSLRLVRRHVEVRWRILALASFRVHLVRDQGERTKRGEVGEGGVRHSPHLYAATAGVRGITCA